MEILIIAGYVVLAAAGLPIAAIAYVAARQAWRCGRLYVTTLAATLGIPDPATAALAEPRHRSAPGQEPAFEHYLRRQAWRDLSTALRTAFVAGRAELPPGLEPDTGPPHVRAVAVSRRAAQVRAASRARPGHRCRHHSPYRDQRRAGRDRRRADPAGPGRDRRASRRRSGGPARQAHRRALPDLLPARQPPVLPVPGLPGVAPAHQPRALRATAPALRLRADEPADATAPGPLPDGRVLPGPRVRCPAARAGRRHPRDHPARSRGHQGPGGPGW